MKEDINNYYKAKKKVEKIKKFYGHLSAFFLINIVLYFFDFFTRPNNFWFDYWFYWHLIIWGVGLIIHGIFVYYTFPFFGNDWEERKMEQFIQEEKYKNNKYE
ncbi:Histidine kinase [Flavobacterium sp. 9AF]|uniref:2TM domain-containing protein n=1 Tax=Flavobacterium sp. 9AF TaxID=2653142 RepID=UPI0012F3F041|nr:2TM domain-containing protein [Flavobacterium sp. 9AF]VXC13484.1 Histidine kinase [Flavobacterium sp. 9AF]